MDRDADKRAFTLLELVLLMAIIALVSAIAAPQLGSFARARDLSGTATQFMEAARWARESAISDGVPYRLNISVSGEDWYITRSNGTRAADGTPATFVQAPGEFAQPHPITPVGRTDPADKISVTTAIPAVEGVVFITFDPTGRTDVATFTFERGNSKAVVTCDGPMGTYYISEGR